MPHLNTGLFTEAQTLRVREVILTLEDDLQTHREKLARIVLDEMYQFVGLLDAAGMTLEINRAALDGAGIRLDEIQGKPFWEARWWQVSTDTQEYQHELVQRASRGEFVRSDIEIYGKAAGEETIIIDFSLLPVRDQTGKIIFLLPEGRNITEKKLAEAEIARKNEELQQLLERIRQMDQLKSDLFANISHEFRTPLSLIVGPVESMLAAATTFTAAQRRDLHTIQRNASTLLKHVNDLLDLSKLDAGKMTIDFSNVELATLVRTAAAHFEALAGERSISYVVVAPESLVAAVDADKIDRIVLNLLSNAFKFTPPGGRIRCALENPSDHRLLLAVQDSGPGVPANIRDAIFERFRQLQAGTTRNFGGTGLGLAIVKDFVELHSGVISVTDAPGGGALFQVELPVRPPAGTFVRQAEPLRTTLNPITESPFEELQPRGWELSFDGDSTEKPLVLIVEDNSDMRRFIAEVLRDDYRLALAADGAEALTMALAKPPDLVITDLMMPKLGGDRLASEMRSRPSLAQIPVLVLSAKADDDLRLKLLKESVQDYIVKPFSHVELRIRARNLITMKRARDLMQAELDTQSGDLSQLASGLISSRQSLQQAQEKLRQSERRFRLLVENVQDYAIFMLDPEGIVTTWNAGAENIKGYKADEIIGRHFSCFYLPEDVESGKPDRALRDAVAAGRFADAGWRLRKDGSRFWADINVTALRDLHGELIGFSKITRDLTERRQAETKSQELKDELAFELSAMTRLHDLSTRSLVKPELPQLLAEVLDATIALHDADFGNAQLFDPERGALEIVAQRGFEKEFLDHFKEVRDENSACGRAWASGRRVVIEDVQADRGFEPHRRIATAAGVRAVQSTPLISRGGELLGMLSTHFRRAHRPSEHTLRLTDLYARYAADMIDRKRAEESQSKLASLVENSLDFIGIATPDGQAVFVNRAGQRLVGLDGDQEARSKRIEEYVLPEDRPRLFELVLPAVFKEDRWEGEIRFRHFKTGTAIPMHQHVFFIKEPGTGRNLALATISRDMRERKQAQEAMLAAQAQLAHISRVVTMGELTASVAHEINQPLSAIVNNANACRRMLKSGSTDLEEVEHTVTDIAELGRRADEVISNIRAFLRKSLPGKSRLEINPVIHEVIAFMASELSKNGVSIHTDLSPKLPQVLGDRVQLQQVLLNLMINAVEAMSSIVGRSRELWIRSQADDSGTISIAVQDTGAGLDASGINNVFNSFVTTKPGGLGMGLAISRSIIESHEGHLWARPNQNYGATFEFTLPAYAA